MAIWFIEKGGCGVTNAIIEPLFCRIEQINALSGLFFITMLLSINGLRRRDSPYLLGTMYEKGLGVKKNRREARKWFAKAKEQGYTGP